MKLKSSDAFSSSSESKLVSSSLVVLQKNDNNNELMEASQNNSSSEMIENANANYYSSLSVEPGITSACNFLLRNRFTIEENLVPEDRRASSLPSRYRYQEINAFNMKHYLWNANLNRSSSSHLLSALTQRTDVVSEESVESISNNLQVERSNKKISPSEFKLKLDCIKEWFHHFDSDQKNLTIKALLEDCGSAQNHFLSVIMENKSHQSCPPNCQDLLSWLPSHIALYIFSFLDPVSLARASRVCRSWNNFANEPRLWQRFCRDSKWQLSVDGEKKYLAACTRADKTVDWKRNFIDRFRLRRNWLKGCYHVRTFEGHSQGISCVQFDDTRIVSGSSDKTIKVWNIRTNSPWSVMTLVGHSGTVRCLHLEGNRLVSGSSDRTIKVWDLSTEHSWSSIACKVTMIGHTDTVRCLQVDEKKVVSGSYDQTLKVWDVKTGDCQLTLTGHSAAVMCVQFDSIKIVSGSGDKTIKIWNLESGNCLKTLHGHEDAVTCLQFDDSRILSGSLDRTIKLWNVESGECFRTLDWMKSEGHTGVIRCLQADCWRFISGGDDKTLKVWSLETGQRLVTLRNHTDGITCLKFNDNIIVSGSYDKTVKLCDFSIC